MAQIDSKSRCLVNENNTVSFEENYIFRNNRSITSNNDIALTEFVANA